MSPSRKQTPVSRPSTAAEFCRRPLRAAVDPPIVLGMKDQPKPPNATPTDPPDPGAVPKADRPTRPDTRQAVPTDPPDPGAVPQPKSS